VCVFKKEKKKKNHLGTTYATTTGISKSLSDEANC